MWKRRNIAPTMPRHSTFICRSLYIKLFAHHCRQPSMCYNTTLLNLCPHHVSHLICDSLACLRPRSLICAISLVPMPSTSTTNALPSAALQLQLQLMSYAILLLMLHFCIQVVIVNKKKTIIKSCDMSETCMFLLYSLAGCYCISLLYHTARITHT